MNGYSREMDGVLRHERSESWGGQAGWESSQKATGEDNKIRKKDELM